MPFNQFVKDYLTFSKKDRIGIISLLSLVLIIYLLPKIASKKNATPFIKEDTLLQQAIDTIQQKAGEPDRRTAYKSIPPSLKDETPAKQDFNPNGDLFNFDPNILDIDGWKRLGLNDKSIRILNNYRTKGGHFYKPEDLQKIWGLPQGFYERVKSYVVIPNAFVKKPYTAAITPKIDYAAEKREHLTISDINTADTSAFIALPGIGSKLAMRIITFREKLGGFYAIDQLAQTYGLPDSTFQLIKPYLHINANAIHKLNINTATKDELKTHPYIKWSLANAIVEYRNQHGVFKSLDELKNIILIDETTYNKIAPYLSL